MPIKMPTYEELSEEQKAILESDLDQNLLVTGPPGTGKTVIAMNRANQICHEEANNASLIMYNNVLVHYSNQWKKKHNDVTVSTYHKWANRLWKPFNQEARFPTYPTVDGDKYTPDWTRMTPKFVDSTIKIGHLIVDEAQDFSPLFYAAMGMASASQSKSSVTVVADENQRLSENENSSIKEIREGLNSLTPLPEASLTKNYRNTKEIADLAAKFYVGLQTGIASPPKKSGQMPRITAKDDLDAMVNTIIRYAKNNPGHSVLVVSSRLIRQLFGKIQEGLRGGPHNIQCYFQNKYLHGEPTLSTSMPGSVVIVHWRSMKGLESDAVFAPLFESHQMGNDGDVEEKMRMYVMFSRAREYLELQYKKSTPPEHRILKMMRDIASDTIEWKWQ